MVAHHYSVFQQEEVRRSSKLFNFGKRPWRGCLGTDWDELREFEIVFANVIGILAIHGALPKKQNKLVTIQIMKEDKVVSFSAANVYYRLSFKG